MSEREKKAQTRIRNLTCITNGIPHSYREFSHQRRLRVFFKGNKKAYLATYTT